MTLLAFETSCDETSVAIIRDGAVLANLVSSQVALHSEYGGVVPELATREHLRNLLPMARAALKETNLSASQMDAVAATRGPGLPSALMIGLKAGHCKFRHGARHVLPSGQLLFDSYHCSRYNTNTRRLTEAMFHAVFAGIREHLT